MNARVTLASLALHWKRLLPGLAGAVLGALSLAGTLHLSQAMALKAEQQTRRLGPNLLVVMAGKATFLRSGTVLGNAAHTLTTADARALERALPGVEACAPYATEPLPIRNGRTQTTCRLVGTTPDYPQVRAFAPETGRFFTPLEAGRGRKVCVLGRSVAATLFGRAEAALERSVAVGRTPLTVVGIMEEKGADLSGADQDEQVFVPLDLFLRTLVPRTWLDGIYAHLAGAGARGELTDAQAAEAVRSATALLRARHGTSGTGGTGAGAWGAKASPGSGKRSARNSGPAVRPDDFSVFPASQARAVRAKTLRLVWALGLSGALVSFTIGTLGILSLMLLMVRTRRLEIGLRRATGARRRDIVQLFLVEAALVSGAGGALGVAAFMALAPVLFRAASLPPVFDAPVLAGVCALSALFGLAAGAYPAWQASRLEILDVLRDAG
ncbi:MAG: ABC transporter permease [Desulfovibrionaceae bacterium]|jgi:putative ABC transport system permease protein|nr:ABC transporter permease [Desulfovibrionaceae bacterium]